MNYVYELVKYDRNIPGRVLIQDKPGWRCNTSPHWHPELEFVYMIDGSLNVMMNGQEKTIHDDEFYFCDSKQLHYTRVPDNKANYRYIVLLISNEFLRRFHSECIFDITDTDAYLGIKRQLKKLVDIALQPEEKHTSGSLDLKKNIVIFEICDILLSRCISTDPKYIVTAANYGKYAKTIIDYVGKNYTKDLSLTFLSELVGLTPQYLSKYFKKETNMGINQYINLVRLENANKYLLNSNDTIMDVALEHGFADVKTYVRACKATYGMTPSQIRKNAKTGTATQ